jgi:excisionase family DNA binding protein
VGGGGASVGARAVLVSRLGSGVWLVVALLSAAAGCRVGAATRARGTSPLAARAPVGPSRLTGPAARARTPAPDPAPAHVLARHGVRAGGPFRDLRASLKQRPMTDEARRSPDHPFGGSSHGGVTSEPQLAAEADGPRAPATFLSTDECARRAMLSRKAIYRAIESGELLAFRVRARLRVPEEEFSRWMTADPVSRAPSGPHEGMSARRPARAGSFRSVLRTVERGQA